MAYEVQTTDEFEAWLDGLRNLKAAQVIAKRLLRIKGGLFGDVKPVGEGVSELRIDVGPGYRVYFVQRGLTLVVLLCGGDKSSQRRDITRAKEIAANLE